jgi:hypothetical protein
MIAKMKASGFCCSFCGKSKSEVDSMMTGTPQQTHGVPQQMIGKSAYICSDCVRRYSTASQTPESIPQKDLAP